MHADDDSLDFLAEESADAVAEQRALQPWRVLIVDDDEEVHLATVFALREARILGCPLYFLHAYESLAALDILRGTPDIAVVLLDVAMETEDAGLRMIGRIREELGLQSVRIILRTGAGSVPDIDAITRYDINDYKSKAELNRSRLLTALTVAIRSYDQITRLDSSRRGLQLIIDGANGFVAEQGLPTFASGVIHQLAALLGVPALGLVAARHENDAATAETGHGFAILAATGHYQTLGTSPVDNPVLAVFQSVRQSFEIRRNVLSENGIALYIAGKNGRDFVAYVEARRYARGIDPHLLSAFGANISVCADNIDLVSRLHQTAYVDGLTGLPNRAALIGAVENQLPLPGQTKSMVALVDIDQFSETIDMLGYRYGDHILIEMSKRLRNALPPDIFVARVGGDIFGLFGSDDLVNPAVLREILCDPLMIEGGAQAVSISLGFVRVAMDMGSGADLLRYAAIALKRAKSDGVGRESYYTAEVATETRERVRLLQNLRHAFHRDDLFVVFQPQVDLTYAKPLGVEALLRWRTEDGGFIDPERFVPIAEQSGLIIPLGAWVLRTALRTLNSLVEAGFPLRMAVNVSAIQFRHPGFFDMLDKVLEESGMPTHLLELEITESVAMFGQVDFEERLQAVKARGIAIAIDDFGTGFSSLSYLDRLTADCLKIDRSFVLALDSQKSGARIAEMVIGLGRRLGMRVLAEGVETEVQATALRQMGCDEAQGWLYGKAVLQDELLVWLRQQQDSRYDA